MGALTDAQRAPLRIKRVWSAARFYDARGAACGVESLLAAEPMTPAQMHEGGTGRTPGARSPPRRPAGTERRASSRRNRHRAARRQRRPSPRNAPTTSRRAARTSRRGARWRPRRRGAGRAAGRGRRRERQLSGRVPPGTCSTRGRNARRLRRARGRRRRRCFASGGFLFSASSTSSGARARAAGRSAFGHTDLMRARPGGSLKPHAVEGKAGSLTAAYVALEAEEVTRGRSVVAAAFAPGEKEKGTRSLLVAYAPRHTRARGAAGRGVLLVWDLGAARRAITHAMTLEGSPTCVAWGPRPPGGQGVVPAARRRARCARGTRASRSAARRGRAPPPRTSRTPRRPPR